MKIAISMLHKHKCVTSSALVFLLYLKFNNNENFTVNSVTHLSLTAISLREPILPSRNKIGVFGLGTKPGLIPRGLLPVELRKLCSTRG